MPHQVNAAHSEVASKSLLAATSATCSVSATYAGSPVTQVKESNGSQSNMFWLNFSGASSTRLEFIVTFNPNSVLRTQTQSFYFPSGYGGATTTPFGVPNWGGNPILGKATLTVIYDGGHCSYDFEVVAA